MSNQITPVNVSRMSTLVLYVPVFFSPELRIDTYFFLSTGLQVLNLFLMVKFMLKDL